MVGTVPLGGSGALCKVYVSVVIELSPVAVNALAFTVVVEVRFIAPVYGVEVDVGVLSSIVYFICAPGVAQLIVIEILPVNVVLAGVKIG